MAGRQVGPFRSGAIFGGEAGAGDAVEDGCLFEMIEADQELDSRQDAGLEGEVVALVVGSFDRLAEVSCRMGKVAGADADGGRETQGSRERAGARALA